MLMEKCLLSCFLLASFKYKVIGGADDYNVLNRDGSYEFGYENPDSYHHSQANRNNIVRGEFGSRNPKTGAIDSTVYTAGPRGFRPRGKNIVRKYDLSQSGSRPIGSRDDPYYDPNEDPSYNFAFKTRTYDRQEASNRVGDVTGKYSYLDDVGERHNVEYIAGKRTGFHVKTPFPDSNPRAYGPLYFNGRGKPIPRGRTSIQRGLDGSYRFISAGPDQRRTETSDATGHVRGSYTYLDDKGVQHSVHYIAGPEIGYRVLKNVKGPHLPTIFPFGRPEILPKDFYDYLTPGADDVFDTAASGYIKPPKGSKPSRPVNNKDDKFDYDNGSDLSGNNGNKFDDNSDRPTSGGAGGDSDNNYDENDDDDQSGGSNKFGGRPTTSSGSSGGGYRPIGSGSNKGGSKKPSYGGGGSSKPDYNDDGSDDDFDLFGNGGGNANKPSKPSKPQNNFGNTESDGAGDDGSYNPSGDDGSYRPGTSDGSGKPSGGSGLSGSGGSGLSGSDSSGSSNGGGSVGSSGSGLSGVGGGTGPSGGGISGTSGDGSGVTGGGSGSSNLPSGGDTDDDFGLFGSGSGTKKPSRPSSNAGSSNSGGVHIGIRPIDSDNSRDDGSYENRGTLVTNVGDKLFAVPPGVSVRAHVQAIDLLPLLPRSPSPSEQLRAEMKDQLKAESSNINEQLKNDTVTAVTATITKRNLRSRKSNKKES